MIRSSRNLHRRTSKRFRPGHPHRRGALPGLERLEGRQLLATLYYNDDWHLETDTGLSGLTAGDGVNNSNDPAGGPVVSGSFGTELFGNVLRNSDDFADGNDDQNPTWERLSPLESFGAGLEYSFPSEAYRLFAPVSPNPGQLGAARGGAALPELSRNFEVSVDIVDFDEVSQHAFGVLARIHDAGLGTTNAYGLVYDTPSGDLNLVIIEDEGSDNLTEVTVGPLDPANQYRIVFRGDGANLTGAIYQLPDTDVPLGTVFSTDFTYTQGQSGLVVANLAEAGNGTSDATFDNFHVTEFLTGSATINDTITAADVDDTIVLLAGDYDQDIFVNKQVTLMGNARVSGSLLASGTSNATISPGLAPQAAGLLELDGVMFSNSTTVEIDLNGVAAGTGYDQIVTPNAALGSANLSVSLGFQPGAADSFTILEQFESGPITSTFRNLPEGATLEAGGRTFQITYVGGDGNDVVLSVVPQTESVSVGASQDNSLFEEFATFSNGAGQYLFSGQTNQNNSRRALVSFDIASAIPAGATIVDASLTLHASKTPLPANGFDFSLHRVTTEWGEGGSNAGGEEGTGAPAQTGDATWTFSQFNTANWNTSGGDFVATPSATTRVQNVNQSYTWTSGSLADDVQLWLENPDENFGWILVGLESSSRTGKRFDSREHPVAANRPTLNITYEPASATPPQVTSIVVNGDQGHPPALPGTTLPLGEGGATVDWQLQRAEIASIVITFDQPVVADPDDFVLTNLGVNAPVDADQVIALDSAQVIVDGSTVTLSFHGTESSPPIYQLPNGVYQLEILPSVTNESGQELDGDGDGVAGDSRVLSGNATNRFYRIDGEWNGDGGVSIFDFSVFQYWFGRPIGVDQGEAPGYMDPNRDEGVSIFDFNLFAAAFSRSVVFPNPLAASLILDEADVASSSEAEDRSSAQQSAVRQPVVVNWSSIRIGREEDVRDGAAEAEREDDLLDLLAADVRRVWA